MARYANGGNPVMEVGYRSMSGPRDYSLAEQRTMTYADVGFRTALQLVVIIAAAAIGWQKAATVPNPNAPMLVCVFAAFVLSIVATWGNKPRVWAMFGYGIFEGAVVGIVSHAYDARYQGIIVQAMIATGAAMAAMCVLSMTPVFRRHLSGISGFLSIAILGYCLFELATYLLTRFHVLHGYYAPSNKVYMLVAAAGILLSALALAVSFGDADRLVQSGAPVRTSWIVSFGLVVSIVWLYLQVVRFLGILRSDD